GTALHRPGTAFRGQSTASIARLRRGCPIPVTRGSAPPRRSEFVGAPPRFWGPNPKTNIAERIFWPSYSAGPRSEQHAEVEPQGLRARGVGDVPAIQAFPQLLGLTRGVAEPRHREEHAVLEPRVEAAHLVRIVVERAVL